jgi:hypothetical protein
VTIEAAEVAKLKAEGLGVTEIAERLGIGRASGKLLSGMIAGLAPGRKWLIVVRLHVAGGRRLSAVHRELRLGHEEAVEG